MALLPYVMSIAALCFLCSFGLLHRKAWMWHLGWVFFYLLASYYGTFFYNGLFEARNNTQAAYAFLYLIGGLLIWLPCVVWWAKNRNGFGRQGGKGPPADGSSDKVQ